MKYKDSGIWFGLRVFFTVVVLFVVALIPFMESVDEETKELIWRFGQRGIDWILWSVCVLFLAYLVRELALMIFNWDYDETDDWLKMPLPKLRKIKRTRLREEYEAALRLEEYEIAEKINKKLKR